MTDSPDSSDYTTPPVLLWISGGRTAWGRMVAFEEQPAARRLHGEETRRDPTSTDTGAIPCKPYNA